MVVVYLPAVKSRGTNLRIHYKQCREIAAAVRLMKVDAAIKYLRDVLDHKRIIPFLVHTGGLGRHAQASCVWLPWISGWAAVGDLRCVPVCRQECFRSQHTARSERASSCGGCGGRAVGRPGG
jgi:ribosomal protein L22